MDRKEVIIESEKLLERKLSNLVKKAGGLSIKIPALHFAGIPDRLILMPLGKAYFVELKTTKQKPRPIQLIVHNQLRKLGFRVDVLDNSTDIINYVTEISTT